MLVLISFDSCRAHVYFDVKISNFGNDPLNMVMIKHVSGDPIRKNSLYENLCSEVFLGFEVDFKSYCFWFAKVTSNFNALGGHVRSKTH